MQQKSRQSTRKYECDTFNQQKYTKCIESLIVEEVGCIPSWYSQETHTNSTTCSGSEKYSKFLELSQNLSKDKTVCKIPNCLENTWTTQDIITTELKYSITVINLSAISKTIEVSNEVFTYELFDIFNDFAGVISLFLGASIISSFDYINETFEKMYCTFTRNMFE